MLTNVSVVIPTYNNLKLLKQFLPSVIRMLRDGDELVIADDASHDQTLEFLVNKFKLDKLKETKEFKLYQNPRFLDQKRRLKITLIAGKQNLRFAQNVNRAVKLAEHDLVFLLNSDVKPEPDVLNILVSHFEKDKASKLFAVSCLEYEGKDKKAEKAGKNQLWYEFGLFTHSKAADFKSGPTAWASGGSALFDKKKWLKLNGFDPKFYPAYWEDVDLSLRARKRGWQVWFEPKAVVYHQHESTNRSVFDQLGMMRLSWRHADYFTLKHGDFWQKLAYFLWRPFWWIKRNRAVKNLRFKN